MALPKNYKLIAEHPNTYEIHDEKDGRSFHVAKHGLNLAMHGKLSQIKKYSKGGDIEDDDDGLPEVPEKAKEGHSFVDEEGNVTINPETETKEEEPFTLSGSDSINPLEGLKEEPLHPEDEDRTIPYKEFDQSLLKKEEEPKVNPQLAEVAATEAAPNSIDQSSDEIQKQKKVLENDFNRYQQSTRTAENAYQKVINKINEIPTPEEIYAKNTEKDQRLLNDFITSRVDPYRVLNERGAGGKIVTVLSILLSGLGQGAYGKNLALEVLDKQIERDIDAQKNEQNKKYTLYKLNLDANQNEQLAHSNTVQQYLLAARAQVEKARSSVIGPEMLKNYMDLSQTLDQRIEQNRQRKTLLEAVGTGQTIQSDPLDFVKYSQGTPSQKQAAIKEIEDMKELKSIKDGMMQAQKQIHSMALNGLFSREQRNALIMTFLPRLSKLAEGRYTSADVESKIAAFFDRTLQGPGAHAVKVKNLDHFFNSLSRDGNFRILVPAGLDKFSQTRFNQSNESFEKTEGLNVTKDQAVKWIHAHANSKDPLDQKAIRGYKMKFNLGQ